MARRAGGAEPVSGVPEDLHRRWLAAELEYALVNHQWSELPEAGAGYDSGVIGVVYAPVSWDDRTRAYLRLPTFEGEPDVDAAPAVVEALLEVTARFHAGDEKAFQSTEPETGRPVAVLRVLRRPGCGNVAEMTEADWTARGIVFYGGSRDGETLEVFAAADSLNLEKVLDGDAFVELYARTSEARDGRTVYRFVERRRDLEGDDDELQGL